MRGIEVLRLVASIVICQAAGGIGAVFTGPALQTWYPTLEKPPFNPPNWVFGPAWAILFTLMGISLFLIWRRGVSEPGVTLALTVFGAQLFLNVLWSVIFFGLQSPFYAFIEIIFLWIAILATVIIFYRISVPAGLLLVPYILWVTFAAVLNYYIVRLNP